jgi:ribonuclease HI
MSTVCYAVKVGRIPGIYSTWNECKKQTEGFSKPVFRKFKTKKEAEEFMSDDLITQAKKKQKVEYEVITPEEFKEMQKDPTSIYVDGGFNKMTGADHAYGWVTDITGACILEKYLGLLTDMKLEEKQLPKHKRQCIIAHFDGVSHQNNGGELLALVAGLRVALVTPVIQKIYSDSDLLLKYWTRGFYHPEKLDAKKIEYIKESVVLRKKFEKRGGILLKIAGKDNPSDGGFHK